MHKKELPNLQEKEGSEGMAPESIMTSSATKQVRSLRPRLKEPSRLCVLATIPVAGRTNQASSFITAPEAPTSPFILTPREQASPHPHNPVFSPGSLWDFLGKGYSGMSQHFCSDCSTRHCLVLAVHYII